MNSQLAGRHALVGGGSQGIGLASARELAALGASVTLLARSEDRLRKAAAALPTPASQKHGYLQVDFDQPESTRVRVNDLLSTIGHVHILVNNSGGPPGGPIVEVTVADFERGLRAHLFTSQLLVQELLPGMRTAEFGRIINIISVSVRQPIPGLGVSNTIRGAMASWAKTLSMELAPFGITVNNILPGATGTDRLFSLIRSRAASEGISSEEEESRWLTSIPMGRFADPREIGSAVAFLASPAASYITGVSLPVDGGFIDAI